MLKSAALLLTFCAALSAAPITISLGSLTWVSIDPDVSDGVHGNGRFVVQVLSNNHDLVGNVLDHVRLTNAKLTVEFESGASVLEPLRLGTLAPGAGTPQTTLEPQSDWSFTKLDYYTRVFDGNNPAERVIRALLEFDVERVPAGSEWRLQPGFGPLPFRPDAPSVCGSVHCAGIDVGGVLPYDGATASASLDITGTMIPEPATVIPVIAALSWIAFRRRRVRP